MEDNSNEKLLPSKWNKKVGKSWRMDVEKYTALKNRQITKQISINI